MGVVSVGNERAIGDVGQTIVDLLEDRMEGFVDRNDIALASPAARGEGGNHWRLTVYLYDVSESPHSRSDERPQPEPGEETVSDRPLVLDLQYLLTAHPAKDGADGTKKTKEQHRVLGRAMQVLRDNAIIRGSDLRGSLAGGDDLQVSIQQESLEAVMNVWNTFPDKAYRPSVAYLVSPVPIESTRERPVERVLERQGHTRELAPEGSGDE